MLCLYLFGLEFYLLNCSFTFLYNEHMSLLELRTVPGRQKHSAFVWSEDYSVINDILLKNWKYVE